MKKKVQSQPLRIESPDYWSLATSRTVQSRLWFMNNPKLEQRALQFLSRYQEKHEIELYAYVLMGNHSHTMARFPRMNRSRFYQDFNARVAEGVRYFVPEFEGGSVFARRYAEQAVPEPEDLEEYFFYCALQPIQAGLCEHLKDYPGYNSFEDAISGIPRLVEDVDWTSFRRAQRRNRQAKVEDFTTLRKLVYKRLPQYDHLSQEEYRRLMLKKFEERRLAIVHQRRAEEKGFLGREKLLKTVPGEKPLHTKTSTRESKRPLVLTKSLEAKKSFLEWYFSVFQAFKSAVGCYFAGDLTVKFPPGTFRPPCFVPHGA